jgi:hypothetical protein
LTQNGLIRSGQPNKINDLLAKSLIGGTSVRVFANRQADWSGFFAAYLSPEQLGAVSHYVERDGTLSILVRSAEWAARLRYSLPPLWAAAQEFRPGLKRWVVKVQPAAASTGART